MAEYAKETLERIASGELYPITRVCLAVESNGAYVVTELEFADGVAISPKGVASFVHETNRMIRDAPIYGKFKVDDNE